MDVFQDKYVAYALVFLALVIPVALWKRDETESSFSTREPGWANLPGLFKMLWGPVVTMEFALGYPLSSLMPKKSETYSSWILASGLPLTPARVFALQAMSFLGGGIIGVLFLLVPGIPPVWGGGIAFLFAVIGWIYPSILLEKYVEWRKGELTRQLPFAIDLIGSAMRAGLEFGAAMRYFAGLKMGGPLTEEFNKVLQQIELGKTRVEALSDMARRVQVEAFTSFVGVVAYGTEIGASISETLKVHGEELRRARFHLAERKAARAPSLMILPMAVFIMPAVFIIIITPVILKMKGSGIGSH